MFKGGISIKIALSMHGARTVGGERKCGVAGILSVNKATIE